MKKMGLAILIRSYVSSRIRVILIAPAFALTVTSCSNLYEPVPLTTDLKAQTLISSTSSLSHLVVRSNNTNLIICSQPQPDAAFDQGEAADFTMSLVSFDGGDQTGEDTSSDEVEMAGRTPAILMARELFYRVCEFSANQQLTKEEAIELYGKTLDTVAQAWKTEATNTTVTVGDTNATTSGITVQKTTTDALTSTESKSEADSETGNKSSSEQ